MSLWQQASSHVFHCFGNHGFLDVACTMTAEQCRGRQCSGNGACHSSATSVLVCLCDSGWTGERCDQSLNSPMETLTIGQKLLKEPIWIGMIVIVNLVMFFCVSYVIRRKCGKKILKLMPKKKSSAVSSKESSSKDESSVVRTPDIFFLPVNDSMATSATSRVNLSDTYTNADVKIEKEVMVPSTPEINENNRDAALKMFASYKAKQSPIHPNFVSLDETIIEHGKNRGYRNSISCGYNEGTVTFSEGDDADREREHSHGILRSYTITSEARELKFDRDMSRLKKLEKFKNSLKITTLPLLNINSNDPTVGTVTQTESSPALVHCYPNIQILNAHLQNDSSKNSDSEASFGDNIDIEKSRNALEVPNALQTNFHEISETNDSGYPSTQTSSSTSASTYTANLECLNRNQAPANVKRKLFASKPKSSSFNKISSSNQSKTENESVFGNGSSTKYPDVSKRQGTLCSECSSFETDTCFCQMKVTHSYDTGLNRLPRAKGRQRGRHSDSVYSCSRSGCCKHDSRRNCCQTHTRNSGRALKYLHARESSRCGSRALQGNAYSKYSSTESDSCACNSRRKKKNQYRSKTCVSDGSFHSRYDLEGHRRKYKCSKHDHRSEPRALSDISKAYKKSMMNSFLSDTCNASFCNIDDFIADNDVFESMNDNDDVALHHQLSGSSNKVSLMSLDENGVVANTTYVQSGNLNDHVKAIGPIRSASEPSNQLKERVKDSCQGIDYKFRKGRLIKNLTDSAYQTKQSSIDANKAFPCQGNVEGTGCYVTSNRKTGKTELCNRTDDKVRCHLQQAAMKLAMIKRFNSKQEVSKDSAFHTFSEEDYSPEDDSKRSFERRQSNSLLAQMKESSLSNVQEELSVIMSKESDSFNTPTNETTPFELTEVTLKGHQETLPMNTFSNFLKQHVSGMEETHV